MKKTTCACGCGKQTIPKTYRYSKSLVRYFPKYLPEHLPVTRGAYAVTKAGLGHDAGFHGKKGRSGISPSSRTSVGNRNRRIIPRD